MGNLEFRNVTKRFGSLTAVEDFSLRIEDDEFVTLIGPSGCGKTTVLRMAAGLEAPDSGEVLENGRPISGPGKDRGMVFQECALFPWRNVRRNVEFGLELMGMEKSEREKTAGRYLELVGLSNFANSRISELSGGMKQRVGIARALAPEPEVLLMDEPFGSLDAMTRNLIQDQLLEIWKKTRKTILFVTHSVDEAVYLSQRVVVLTARPARIKKVIKIKLERPRDRTGPEFAAVRRELLSLVGGEVIKARREEEGAREG